MNITKRAYEEGWVLCPSKSFPGKFYFFNTISGSTLWSSSDVEKRIIKNDIVDRVVDKWHTYPEPKTPPTEECLHFPQNWQYRRPEHLQPSHQRNNQDMQSFGQAVFPKYTPNAIRREMPNYVWAPVSMPSAFSLKPSVMPFDNDPHNWEMKRNFMRQSPHEEQSRHFLNPQRKNYHDNLINVNDPSHLQKLHDRQSFDVKPSHFQNAIEKQSHINWFNANKSDQFRMYQQNVCNESLFNIKKPNVFHRIEENVFGVREPGFHKVHEKTSHEIVNSAKLGTSLNQLHKNLFHTNKFNQFSKPQEKNENIVKQNVANTTTPIKIKWGFDGQTQSQQSNEQQLFQQRQNCQSQSDTAIKEPINRIWTRPAPGTFKTNDNFFRSRSDDLLRSKNDVARHEMPIRVQTYQSNIESNPKPTVTIYDTKCYGKSNLSLEKQFQLCPQKQFQDMRQQIQNESYISDLNENNIAQRKHMQSDISPQKRFQNSKYTSMSPENPNDPSYFEISDSNPQKRFQKKVQTESSRCLQNQESPFKSDSNPRKRVSSTTANSMAMENKLAKIDLRHILLAKRKKVDSDDTQKKGKKTTSYSNYREINKDVSPKKRVTFNIGVEDHETTISHDDEHHMTDSMTKDQVVNTLRNLAKPDSKTDHWYIVVHTDVLIEDFEFIEKFVLSDDKCILLMPGCVRAKIESLCGGVSLGRRRVLAARQLARRLASPPPHIAVRLSEEATGTDMSVNDSILNCCFQKVDENYHVVLITNDIEMCSEAKSMDLHSFTLQEIKEHAAAEKPKLTFEFQKTTTENHGNEISRSQSMIQEVIQNQFPELSLEHKRKAASNKQETFLLQVSNDCDSSAANKKEFPVNVFRKRMFDGISDENKDNPSLFIRNKYAKILTDRVKNRHFTKFPPENITQPNGNDTLEYKESPALTSVTNGRVQKLNLEETSRTGDQWPKTNQKVESRPQAMEVNLKTYSSTIDNKTKSALKLNTINRYTIDEYLKTFIVKHSVSEGRIKTRIDEWLCSFTQIMEETLSDVIQNHSPAVTNKLPPPWTLSEAAECVRDVYGDHTPVRITVERLSALLFENSCKRGYLKLNMASNDFVKIIRCGTILIQCLKSILPNAVSLSDAEESLDKLLLAISDPSCVPEMSALASCELSDPVADERRNFVKKSSDIIAYLEKHVPACQAWNDNQRSIDAKGQTERCDGVDDNLNQADLEDKQKNARTFIIKSPELCDYVKEDVIIEKDTGAKLLRKLALKNAALNRTKFEDIDVEKRERNDKELTAMIDKMIGGNETFPNSGVNKSNNDSFKQNEKGNDKPKVIRNNVLDAFELKKYNKNDEPKVIRNNVLDAFELKKYNKNDEPKVIRNNVLDAFELKKYNKNDEPKVISNNVLDAFELKKYNKSINENVVVNYSVLDYEEDDVTSQDEDNNVRSNDEYEQNSNNSYAAGSNGTTSVSDVETLASQQALLMIKKFFAEFSLTFNIVFRFFKNADGNCNESCSIKEEFVPWCMQFLIRKYGVDELRKGLRDNTRGDFHEKASLTHEQVALIIGHLKSIIIRESGRGPTLKDLMIRAASNVANDRRVTGYRQVVTKCLEQVKMLESALRVFVGATEDARDASRCSTSAANSSGHIQYYNIFE